MPAAFQWEMGWERGSVDGLELQWNNPRGVSYGVCHVFFFVLNGTTHDKFIGRMKMVERWQLNWGTVSYSTPLCSGVFHQLLANTLVSVSNLKRHALCQFTSSILRKEPYSSVLPFPIPHFYLPIPYILLFYKPTFLFLRFWHYSSFDTAEIENRINAHFSYN